MKKRIIGTVLTAAMLASAMTTAFAGFYPTQPLFDVTETDVGTISASSYKGQNVFKWLGGDTFVYKPNGFNLGSESFYKYCYNSTNDGKLFNAGWNPTDIEQDQSIYLGMGMDDVVSDLESYKSAKYANFTRNMADMCEWNGYLFVLMNATTNVRTPDNRNIKTNNMYYLDKQWETEDNPILFAAQQADGTWAKTDVEGNYILDEDGEKITVTGSFNWWITKNSAQIQVYDISGGDKTMVAEWDCQTDMGINTTTRTGADYLTIGLDVEDDYIYCYVAPKGYQSYAYDQNRNMGVAVFKNTIGKSRENANFEPPTRYNLNGEWYDVYILSTGIANVTTTYQNGFRHQIIGNQLLTLTNLQQAHNLSNQNNKYVTITDISDIDNKNVSCTYYKWEDWLGFEIPSNYPGNECVNTNPIYLRDFVIQDNFAYALIQYKNTDGTWDQVITKYDISDLNNPKKLAESAHVVTEGRQITNMLYANGDYIYAVLSYDESVTEREQYSPIILIYKAEDMNKVKEIRPMETNGATNPNPVMAYVTHVSTFGDYLYVVFTGNRGFNNTIEYVIQLSDDKTEIIDSYVTSERMGGVSCQSLIYGNKLYLGTGSGSGYTGAGAVWWQRINVIDMKNAYPVDLKVDPVPAVVEAPYTITGCLAGAPDYGNIFQVTVNGGDPIFITDEEVKYADGVYNTLLNYTIEEPGDYTVTIAPIDQVSSEAVEKAAETVSFTVKPAAVPEEFKLSAAYSSSTIAEGKLTVTPKITNNIKQGEIKCIPVAALYKDNKLVDVKTGTEQTIAEGAYLQPLGALELTVPADTDYSKYNVKVFLFDSLKTFKPLLENVSLKK